MTRQINIQKRYYYQISLMPKLGGCAGEWLEKGAMPGRVSEALSPTSTRQTSPLLKIRNPQNLLRVEHTKTGARLLQFAPDMTTPVKRIALISPLPYRSCSSLQDLGQCWPKFPTFSSSPLPRQSILKAAAAAAHKQQVWF